MTNMISQFDVSNAPLHEQFPLWQRQMAHAYRRTSERPRLNESFNACMVRNQISWLEVSEITCDPASYTRTGGSVGPDDSFFSASVLLEGIGHLTQAGRRVIQRPGDLVIYDTSRPFTYRFETSYRILLVRVPRRAMLARFPDASRFTSLALSENLAITRLFTTTARNVARLDLGSSINSARLAASIFDVMAACIEEGFALRPEPKGPTANLLVVRARQHMLAHIDDTEITVDQIATALRVSKRSLSRAFAQENDTPIRWLWRQRLALSHRRILEGSHTSVTELALSCGFTNSAHFSRAFRQAFKQSPSEMIGGLSSRRAAAIS